jgi:hypothetical protein
MKIIITESQFTIMDWFNYNEELFEKLFNNYTSTFNISNYIWTNDANFVCKEIIKNMVKRFEYIRFANLEKEHSDLLMDIYGDKIINKFRLVKKKYNEKK